MEGAVRMLDDNEKEVLGADSNRPDSCTRLRSVLKAGHINEYSKNTTNKGDN